MRRKIKNIYDDIDTDINEEVKKIFTFTKNRNDRLTVREVKQIFKDNNLQVKSNHVNKYMRINGCKYSLVKSPTGLNEQGLIITQEAGFWGITKNYQTLQNSSK